MFKINLFWIKYICFQISNRYLFGCRSNKYWLNWKKINIKKDICLKIYFLLQIKDIQETDAGMYQCQIIITINNIITADVELRVLRPPVISDNSTRSLVVSEGQPIQLECYAGGYPTPRVSWRRENNVILPTGGSIYQ